MDFPAANLSPGSAGTYELIALIPHPSEQPEARIKPLECSKFFADISVTL